MTDHRQKRWPRLLENQRSAIHTVRSTIFHASRNLSTCLDPKAQEQHRTCATAIAIQQGYLREDIAPSADCSHVRRCRDDHSAFCSAHSGSIFNASRVLLSCSLLLRHPYIVQLQASAGPESDTGTRRAARHPRYKGLASLPPHLGEGCLSADPHQLTRPGPRLRRAISSLASVRVVSSF